MVAVASCGGSEGKEPVSAAPTSASTSAPSAALGEARDSGFEGFPVPSNAALDAEGSTPGESLALKLPPGTEGGEVDAWYGTELPNGSAVGPWTWCRREDAVAPGDAGDRVWHRPGTNERLSLTVGQDGGRAFILLFRDASGEGYCG